MSKQMSLYALVGLVAVAGILFYRVIEPFAIVLFISIVLAVLFEPLFQRLVKLLRGRIRIAAAITTACVLLLIIVPIGAVLLLAGGQMAIAGKQVVAWFERTEGGDLEEALGQMDKTALGGRLLNIYENLNAKQKLQLKDAAVNVTNRITADLYQKTRGLVGDLVALVVGMAIMTLGLYYFLADGRAFLREAHRLLPLEKPEEEQLFEQFQLVCRGVVLGTVVAGLAQAILAGIAFGILGIEQLWLLVVLTMFCSFIPFVGAVTVWAPVAIALFLNQQYAAAIGLTLFGLLIISSVDNLIRAYIIGGEARLHPLVALVTVLGALKLVGLWGIFIGPMVAAFFYALAQILRQRILATSA